MDPEQTFLRVHARLSGMLSQLLTPRIRMTLEYIYLVVALALFALLVVMHTNFVQQPGCSSELSGVEIAEAQLVQIKITSVGLWSQYLADRKVIYSQNQGISTESLKISDGNGDGFTFSAAKFWAAWISSGARRSKLNFKFWKGDKEFLESQVESAVDGSIKKPIGDETEIREDIEAPRMGLPISARESFKSSVNYFLRKRYMQFSSFQKNMQQFPLGAGRLLSTAGWDVLTDFPNCLQMLHLEHLKSLIVQWLEKRSKAFEPTYLYTLEKGYFLLPEGAKFQHNIRTVNVSISAHHSCFGNRWQQLLINSFVGYDTILMNSLLSFPGAGYLYNFQTKEFYDLSYGPKTSNGRARFGDYLVTKCSVLIMSLFVFFTTTMSVSFTLRETQSRMLKFTVQLQHHARHQLPTFQLIFVHVIESLVFVPIMIGILFFLFEFYDDQLLAFLVLTLVWLCELFTMISVRTPISMQFFPRFFLLYFLMFHIYFFSYAYGFSYLAFSTTAAFMQHLILYFWNRHEVPALQRFLSRTHFQQQAGVQVTSSTILTSTLHIARVSMRSPAMIVNDGEMVTGPGGGRAGSRTTDSVVEAAGDSNTTETEQSATGRDHSDSSIVGSGHHHQLPSESEGIQQETETAAPNHHPGSSSSLNPFSSLLLWILGGTSSDSLVSFFSMFRDLRDDQDQVYAPPPPPPPPPHGNEPST